MKENRRSFVKKVALSSLFLPFGLPTNLGLGAIPKERKLRVALVGLGRYATRLAQGIALSQHCEVAGIVTGTPSKIPKWREKYDISENSVYNYENFDEIINNKAIDVVYVVLPGGGG